MDHLDGLPPHIRKALDTLDAKAAKKAERVNAERVAAQVLERLRDEDSTPVPALWSIRLSRGVRVAAAVVLLIGGGLVASAILTDGGPGAPGDVALPFPQALDALTPALADSLLDAVNDVRSLNVAATPTSVGVEELSEQELRALLQAMQSSLEGSL